jgi:flagellar protein FliO/FliZ
MSLTALAQTGLSLVFVLALIGGCAWVAHRFGFARRVVTGNTRRLSILEVAPVDAKRRLVLVRRDNREHLLLVGPAGDLLIESAIEPSGAPSFADMLEQTR